MLSSRHWCRSGLFIANFGHIWYSVLVFLLLTLNKETMCGKNIYDVKSSLEALFSLINFLTLRKKSWKCFFYSSKRWMLMRNWGEKTLFSQLVVIEENPSELVASNQQNQYQNNVHYVNCNICQRVFKTNRGLLQHLSFCS